MIRDPGVPTPLRGPMWPVRRRRMESALHEAMARYLAGTLGLEWGKLRVVKVEASPGRAFSEWTSEDFSCWVTYTYEGKQQVHMLEQEQVCSFLNGVWAGRTEEPTQL